MVRHPFHVLTLALDISSSHHHVPLAPSNTHSQAVTFNCSSKSHKYLALGTQSGKVDPFQSPTLLTLLPSLTCKYCCCHWDLVILDC